MYECISVGQACIVARYQSSTELHAGLITRKKHNCTNKKAAYLTVKFMRFPKRPFDCFSAEIMAVRRACLISLHIFYVRISAAEYRTTRPSNVM